MQKCRTLNGDQRAALRETREIRRTHETHETDKTYKTQARRSNEQTETDRLQVRTPANARRNQLAGGTATGDCSFAMFAFMAGFSIRFGRSVQEVGWRRQVRFQRRSRATQSTPCGGIVPVMTRSAPHAFKTHVGGLARRVGDTDRRVSNRHCGRQAPPMD